MPREHRKRGQRKKKQKEGEDFQEIQATPNARIEVEWAPQTQPSWIEDAPEASVAPENNFEAPWGYVDPDVKAYFRTVEEQMLEWQSTGKLQRDDTQMDKDPNEERRMFFAAALQEMRGKELQLATDPDCSSILERMVYSMDDLVRRLFIENYLGSFCQLITNRFASHVVQSFLVTAVETITRETQGIFPATQVSPQFQNLQSLTDLVLVICEELESRLSSMLLDPFASHVVRALFILLDPHLSKFANQQSSAVRSKRSAGFKARQGAMLSVFDDDAGKLHHRQAPDAFLSTAKRMLSNIRQSLSPTEIRALAANKVAAPTLKILLELEANFKQTDMPGSIADSILMGVITDYHSSPPIETPESDYVGTLLRDQTASHVLQTIIKHAPPYAFHYVWRTYFVGKLARLAVHPIANFIVTEAIGCLDVGGLKLALSEVEKKLGKAIDQNRSGPLRAFIDRASALKAHQEIVVEIIRQSFDIRPEDNKMVIPKILYFQKRSLAEEANSGSTNQEPTIQGALLLQSLLRLEAPHNELITSSIEMQPVEELLGWAQHKTSSHVLDMVFESPTVTRKSKRALIMAFIGHYHLLVDDKFGSRVGDRCWDNADPYLKEKVARSVIPHEYALAGSLYGKFFTRRLHLSLLQRKPEEWKTLQARQQAEQREKPQARQQNAASKPAATTCAADVDISRQQSTKRGRDDDTNEVEGTRKRKREVDEVDAIFGQVKENRFGKVGLPSKATREVGADKIGASVPDDILGAIKAAPKGEMKVRRKRKA